MTSESIKLVYLINGLELGGAEVGMSRLLNQLPADEFEIVVIGLRGGSGEVDSMLASHITVRELLEDQSRFPQDIRTILRDFFQADLLICSLFHASLLGTFLGHIFRVPDILLWQHSIHFESRWRKVILSVLYRTADRVLVDSNTVCDVLVEDLGIDEGHVEVLPIAGVDTDHFHPRRGGNSSGEILVGSIGRITEPKGFDVLIDCARELGDDFRFEVIGEGPDLREFRRTSPENVRFLGHVDNERLPEYLGRYDIYFQPSRYEGLCITVVEAMSCGLPVVGSAIGGISESVRDGHTGYLCPPLDVDCFCAKLEHLRDHPDERSTFGKNGRRWVEEYYSDTVFVREFVDLLERLGIVV